MAQVQGAKGEGPGDRDIEALLHEVHGHAAAHDADADEAELHHLV